MPQIDDLESLSEKVREALMAAREYAANYPSREASLVVTKLDEAKLWMREHARRMAS